MFTLTTFRSLFHERVTDILGQALDLIQIVGRCSVAGTTGTLAFSAKVQMVRVD